MNLAPHTVFTLGVAFFLVSHFPYGIPFLSPILAHYLSFTQLEWQYTIDGSSIEELVLWAGFLAWAVNQVIDLIGHKAPYKGAIPIRMARTHSIYTAPLWGILCAVVATCIITLFSPANHLVYFSIFFGVCVAYSHLFLDVMTEGGIYIVRTIRGRSGLHNARYYWAQYKYDNQIVNALAVLAGITLISLSTHLAIAVSA